MDLLIMVRPTLIAMLLVLSGNSYAQQSTAPVTVPQHKSSQKRMAQTEVKEPLLIASPNTCELTKGTYLCEIKAALIWEAAIADDFCLYEAETVQPIQCWQNAWSGNYVLQFQSNKTVTYVLKQANDNIVLSSASINVIGTLEQRMRAKRRRKFFRMF